VQRLFDHEKLEVYQSSQDILPGKDRLWSIVSMLVALIRANSDYRLHDDPSPP
jgi:hypothetical protein